MQFISLFRRWAVACVVSCAALTGVAYAEQQPFSIDDIYRMESLGQAFRESPDGRYVAFLVKRPVNSGSGAPFHFHQ